MDAPRCRICGASHWLNEPCSFTVDQPVAADAGVAVTGRPRVRRKAKRGTFDRTAYQRDYMRKWRGRQRSKAV